MKKDIRKLGLTTSNDVGVTTTPDTLVTPANNTNGILISNLHIDPAGGRTSVIAKTSAPSTAGVTEGIIIASAISSQHNMNTPVIIPAGYGLYTVTAAGTSAVMINYNLL